VQTLRAVAQVHEGAITVTGVPAADGEMVQVIVIRGTDDAERYAGPPAADNPMGWDGEGWDDLAKIDVPVAPACPAALERSAADANREIGWQGESYEQLVELFAGVRQRPSR
jgi:hypothetical protein